MLKINKELLPRFKAAYQLACELNKRKNFIRAMRYAQWSGYDCILYPDFCEHSFCFSIVPKGGDGSKVRIHGGIIYHESDQTWRVHT